MTHSENTIYIRHDFDHEDLDFLEFKSMCAEHGIKIVLCSESNLYFHDSRVKLVGAQELSFFNDWVSQFQKHMKNKYAITKEPLAKALGIKGNCSLTVLDATLGTGKDSVLILSFGAKVIAYERNLNVFVMALDAYRICLKDGLDIFKNLSINFGDAINCSSDQFDVVYFDPMYPEKKKSSLPRKEMQIFKEIVGADEDFLDKLIFFKNSKKKVVLKRPIKSEAILKASSSFPGKTTRYDLYLN